MRNFDQLNEYQKAAVLNKDKTCLLNACVGSGKTTVLIEKIRYLHEEKKIAYEDMIVLTFTNKAAGEIRTRMEGQLEEAREKFGTFHSVALELLKNHLPIEKAGYTREFVVIDPEEEIEMALQLITKKGLTIKYKNRLKKRLEQARAVTEPERRVSRYQDDIFLLTELLQEEKRKQNKMSFTDLLEQAVALLREEKENPGGTKMQSPTWLIVDEVQDCDALQLEFLDVLRGESTHLFAVGDPNQVIYSWRGSAFHIFYNLKQRYNATELTLPINYRCSEKILRAAKMFSQNGTALMGEKSSGGMVRIKRQYDSFQEAVYLADQIRGLREKGVRYEEIAIFYRLQKQADQLIKVLEREQIPCEISQKQSIRQIPVLNWLLQLLKASLNQKDETAALLCLMDKNYGYGMTQKKAMALWNAKTVSEKAGVLLLERIMGFSVYLDLEKKEALSAQNLYDYFCLDEFLHPTAASYPKEKEQVMHLLTYFLEAGAETGQYEDVLNQAALDGTEWLEQRQEQSVQEQSGQRKTSEGRVQLMTLHASKGLEFSHVFIIGVNGGLIPLSRKANEEEEERRLFFVGMTRAKEYLELSYYTNPDDRTVRPGMSPYLSILPKSCVEQADEETVDLRELKKQIQAQKRQKQTEPEAGMEAEVEEQSQETVQVQEEPRRVRHAKYGDGTVTKDDGVMIEVAFDDYGTKEFMAGFCVLEDIK